MSILADADWVTHSLRVGYLRYVDDHYARQVIEDPFDGSHGLDSKAGDLSASASAVASGLGMGLGNPYGAGAGFAAEPHAARMAGRGPAGQAGGGGRAMASNMMTPYPAAMPPGSAQTPFAGAAQEPTPTELPRAGSSQAFTQADLLQPRNRSKPRTRSRPSGSSLSGTQLSGTTAVDASMRVTNTGGAGAGTAANGGEALPEDDKVTPTPSPSLARKGGIAEAEPPPSLAFTKLSLSEVRARSQQQQPQVSAIAATLQAESDAAANPFAALYRDVCLRIATPAGSPGVGTPAATTTPPSPAPATTTAATGPPGVKPGVGRFRHGAAGRSLGPMRGRMQGPGGSGPKRPGGAGRIEVYFPFADKATNAKLTPPPSPSPSPLSSKPGPLQLKPKAGSMTLSVRPDAKMEEVIGYALYCYVDAKWEPRLPELKDWAQGDQDEIKLTTLGYCLRIVDDGEVDDDFPALDRSLAVGKFGGDEFAVCQASASQIKENEVTSAPFRASRKAALAASLKAAAKAAAKATEPSSALINRALLDPAAAANITISVHGGSVTPQLSGKLAAASTVGGAGGGGGGARLAVPGPVAAHAGGGGGGGGVTASSSLAVPGNVGTSVNSGTGSATPVGPTGVRMSTSLAPSALSSATNAGTAAGGAAAPTSAVHPQLSSSVGGAGRSLLSSGLAGSAAGGGGGAGGTGSGGAHQLEATVFLRVLHNPRQNVHVKIMIQVAASMYFADVLDLICRKVQEEQPEEWALVAHFGEQDVVVPLNRTVESLDEACDLKLVRRHTLAERGAIGRLTAPGGNPNTSIFSGQNKANKQDFNNALDMSAYKSWKVIRSARSARMFSKPERLLTLDGEWIWIEPADSRHFTARPTSFHISSVVACKQSTKGGASFKLVVRRQPSVVDASSAAAATPAAGGGVGRDTKRYDLEAESVRDAEEIVSVIQRVMARRQESGAE